MTILPLSPVVSSNPSRNIMSWMDGHVSVVGAGRDGLHTHYVLHVQTSRHDATVVVRRYSAFIQLRKYVLRSIADAHCCCGPCLLRPALEPLFDGLVLDTTHVFNTPRLVRRRMTLLGRFLDQLRDALQKCPTDTLVAMDAIGCKTAKLIQSFLGLV
ncbi:Aste57867_18432 [Aphanomyces stellatus]|uniref:Aste57867_18432 protein n=1 Tax=Aphanomyces stellatus TaxID=120398 RepID=A0A485LBU8_9STRA|nr:hypothetical protein As57867_018370 [Aphanomyces stellatus]VFT95168.1 Aste57867_18432 [Aphanomyces stellatus]